MGALDRQPFDKKIAQMENNQMMAGMAVQVDPSESFVIHLREHIGLLWSLANQYKDGEVELVDVVPRMGPVFQHTLETFEIAVVPEVEVPELNKMKQSIQQLAEIIENGQKAIQKIEREQQAQPQEAQQPQVDPTEVKIQNMIAESQAKIAIDNQEHEAKMIRMQQEHAQKVSLADAEAAKIIRDTPIDR